MIGQRWIILGELWRDHYVMAGGSGTPGGFLLVWTGRVSWCQPCEFRSALELRWAIRRRLLLAGLEAVATWLEPLARNKARLRVLVKRLERKTEI